MKPHHVKEGLDSIEARNRRVEADKAWETSWARRGIIAVGTYGVIGGYLTFLKVEDAWLHAFVPALAYILSTLSLFVCKKIWLRTCYVGLQEKVSGEST